MNRNSVLMYAAIMSTAALCAAAPGQFAEAPEPDADAMEAFSQLVERYRARPALEVESTLSISLVEGDVAAHSEDVAAKIVWSSNGGGIVRIRAFTCMFEDGVFIATHEDNEDDYLRVEFDGSPYWVIFDAFRELPYPHLALFWGERDVREVCMQIAPDTPMIVPTTVATEEADGQTLQRIVLSSENGSLTLRVDPESGLIRSARHEVTAGPLVQPGTKKVTRYAFEYVTHEEPLPAERFAFEAGDRQRVDLMASLRPAPAAAMGGGAMPAAEGQAGLVGQPAPPLMLATADGGAIDLADLRGKVVVVDFWATWCRPCVAALPKLHEVAEWAHDEDLPVEVVTVNVFEAAGQAEDTPDARLQAARAFWSEHGFSLPVAMDYTDETAAAYRVQGIPATFVIRSDGVVHAQHTGFGGDYVGQLKRDIRAALEALEEPATDDDTQD